MRRISILGIVLGSIVAVALWFVLNLGTGIYAVVKLDLIHQRSQVEAQAMAQNFIYNTGIYYVGMAIAFFSSVCGGWVSAFTARQAERINGALSALGLICYHWWGSVHHKDPHGVAIQALYVAVIITGAWVGGRLRAGQTARTAPARLSAV